MTWLINLILMSSAFPILYVIYRLYTKAYIATESPEVVYQNLALRRRNIEVAAIPVVEMLEHQEWLKDVEAFKRQEK